MLHGRRGKVGCGELWRGGVWPAWSGWARCVLVGLGRAGEVRRGAARPGPARFGVAGMVGRGEVRFGVARQVWGITKLKRRNNGI